MEGEREKERRGVRVECWSCGVRDLERRLNWFLSVSNVVCYDL